jgi:uracil-DNA glycosylase
MPVYMDDIPVLDPSWKHVLRGEFEKTYCTKLASFVREEYRAGEVYPQRDVIFNAFTLCPFDAVKVVILGQDPYHGPGQAHGLSFSVPDGVRIPPSLQNVYKELKRDLSVSLPPSGNLEHWARQGVLLLNAVLTVRAGSAGSHQGKGWEQFTDSAIQELAQRREHLVFMLWGNYAHRKKVLIREGAHLVLEAPHPSPLSAHAGFLGCGHFSKANKYLIAQGISPIVW